MNPKQIEQSVLLQLKRWNTPTIYNGWEQITKHDSARECFNLEDCRDYMPQMGPMVGYAVTVICQPGNPAHQNSNSSRMSEYRAYVGSLPGPKIVVVQDLDKPFTFGSYWGEVNACTHKALGCVGTITDGAIRDLDEMVSAGFKAIARRLCVGHAYSTPVHWNCEIEVFGTRVKPGQLIHADKHGFLAIPEEDVEGLLDASRFMDSNECNTVIAASRETAGQPLSDVLERMANASSEFKRAAHEHFKR